MLHAFWLGLLAQSSLLLAGLLVFRVTMPPRLVGALAGFGAGALIAAVSFDLIGTGVRSGRRVQRREW